MNSIMPTAFRMTAVIAAGCACLLGASVAHAAEYIQAEEVISLLQNQQFDELEAMESKLRDGKLRTAAGRWQMDIFYDALENNEHMGRLETWKKVKPDSVAPRIALARNYKSLAWDYRGSGYANTVSEGGFKRFEEELSKGWKELEEGEKLNEKDPELYAVKVVIAMGLGKPAKEIKAIFERGVALEPSYYHLYENYGDSLLPRWGGDSGDVEKFARRAVELSRATDGETFYARMAINCLNYVGVNEFVMEHKFDWPMLHKSFTELRERFPESVSIPHQFCRFAGLYKDQETAMTLFAGLGDKWKDGPWNGEEHFNRWKDWATKGGHYPGLGGLFEAATKGDTTMGQSLLDAGADINAVNEYGDPPVVVAIEAGKTEFALWLLERNANPNKVGNWGRTPLYAAADNSDIDMVGELMNRKADINAMDQGGWTPIIQAASNNDLEMVQLLIKLGADLNRTGSDAFTALYQAASSGNPEMVSALLNAGADPNKAGRENWTPLMLACSNESKEIVQLLIAKGADPNIRNSRGNTALAKVAEQGRWDLVGDLLDAGADPNILSNEGHSPLMDAATAGSKEGIILLIAKGANVNEQTEEGWAPIHLAAVQGHNEALLLLLDQPGIDVSLTNKHKETVLHWAARKCDRRVIERLLAMGMDPMQRAIYGTTALGDARLAKRPEIEELLRVAVEKNKK